MRSVALNDGWSLDGSVVLSVKGVVDDDTVEDFERGLDVAVGTGFRQLVIDLTACQLASAGLAALIRLHRRSSSRPAATLLVAAGVDQLRMLQIVGLASRFRTYTTVDAALHSCCSVAPVAAVNGTGTQIRHLTSVDGFGPARSSRPIQRGGRPVLSGSRAATDAGNE